MCGNSGKKESNMRRTEQEIVKQATLAGTMEEFLTEYGLPHEFRKENIENAFAGKNPSGDLRIPAADTGHEVFFGSRELLVRFASLAKPSQEDFLKAVRGAMEKEKVGLIRIQVRWSNESVRIIEVKLLSPLGGILQISLLQS